MSHCPNEIVGIGSIGITQGHRFRCVKAIGIYVLLVDSGLCLVELVTWGLTNYSEYHPFLTTLSPLIRLCGLSTW
ncbi:hypothetical protein BDM02DRAFT_3114951 [Thelephora ganbajun]|uniref:Uncharacterized protein n=1 Tax=Thelephora ganbajun TaxID=370292 RepID=A0ACB6ZGR6_THEGA|nr:hypothetical protein BDM02DRAFT_3114951 [Thelephora ganbajun]